MPKTPNYFENKTIMVTGGASGIGRATALIFAREGSNVIIGDINLDKANSVAAEIREIHGDVEVFKVNVTERSMVDSMVEYGIDHFGKIDFLLNSAGSAGRRSSFLEIDQTLWRDTYDLNVDGIFNTMQSVLPHMLQNESGVIINIASMAHRRGGGGHSIHYASAKGAVVTLTMGVAREFVDRGIRAISISPGPIDTAFQDISSEELKKKMIEDVPMKRMGTPEEIGEMALFLCSDACEFLTADTIYVNGGGGFR
ncbi:MAG: SDR family oxidoreductase [Pseudomonadota bacterium]|nr:SDR family oxidoreductase [Pseudomonadota bacterium]